MYTKRKRFNKKGGSLRRTTRTIKPTIVEQPAELTVDELSGKIQWLIDFAGTENVMEAIIEYFVKSTCKNTTREIVTGKLDPSAGYKNKLIFNTHAGDVGHWIYFSKTGEEFNSYKLGHQKPATNQFCQSFAILYMLHNCGIKNVPKFYNRLEKADSTMRLSEKYEKWGHNIEVIIDMWKWLFEKWSNMPIMKTWLLGEIKKVNNDYIAHNAKTRAKAKKMTLISENTDNITLDIITLKLNDIVTHKKNIAEKT